MDSVKYRLFKEQQSKLAELLSDSSQSISELEMAQCATILSRLSEKIKSDSFKVLVVGTFNNGKSSFINSLLGEAVLPAYSLPTTAVINEIKYGAEKRVVLHFKKELPDEMPSSVPAAALQHMDRYGRVNVPPMEVPYEDLEQFVVIPIDCTDPKQMLLETPYEKVELFWPLDLLKEGVEIIDSPGLNECKTRTGITMDYVTKADAVLFVLNATALCAQDEMSFIENNLKAQGFEEPFFIVNKIDLVSDRETPRIKQYANMVLSQYTTNDIFFVSAMKAIEAQKANDASLYTASGIENLEKVLTDFLVSQKGKAKLLQPARELSRIVNEDVLYKSIPMQRQMLGNSLSDLITKQNELTPKLAQLTAKKDLVYGQMKSRIEMCSMEVKRASEQQSIALAGQISAWLKDYNPTTSLGLVPSEERVKALADEIFEYLRGRIEKAQQEWQTKCLSPLIDSRTALLFDSVEDKVAEIHKELDKIKMDLSGGRIEGASIPTWKRVAGATLGLAFGGVDQMINGATNGIGASLVKSIMVEMGCLALVIALQISNPLLWIPMLMAPGFIGTLSGAAKAQQQVKDKIRVAVCASISEKSVEQASKISGAVESKLMSYADGVVNSLQNEIADIQKQLDSIVEAARSGQEMIDRKTATIAMAEEKLQGVSVRLNTFLFDLVN